MHQADFPLLSIMEDRDKAKQSSLKDVSEEMATVDILRRLPMAAWRSGQ
jgi:hypothetical protein